MRLKEIADRLLPLVQELTEGSHEHEHGAAAAKTILLAVWHVCDGEHRIVLRALAMGVDETMGELWGSANRERGA